MDKLNEELKEESTLNSDKNKNNLVLTINNEGRITKFNNICEQTSGYLRDDIINKNFFDQLIPNRYFNLWLSFFDNSQQNKMIHDFKLPIRTKHGHEIMVSWSSFPVKNIQNDKMNVDLVGTIISSWKDFETPKITENIEINKEKPKSSSIFSKKIRISKSRNNPKLIEKLKSLNKELEKKNKILENKIKDFESREAHLKDKLEKTIKQSNLIVNKGLYSFSELYGGKKRKEEFETKEIELNEREKILNKLEKKLLDDKEKINKQFDDFRIWREKLESLEDDIEKRRMDLMNQERVLLSDITGSDDISVSETTKEDLKKSYDVFEKISDSAAIIQRGIFKRVNESFVNLIGYNLNEIIDRSLFDFVSPEGFVGMEKYYLNRLKGENISTYNTVILSKDNNKIPVEINSNPTFIDGEKAEIAVFKKSKDEKEKIVDEIKKDEKIDDEPEPEKKESDEMELDKQIEKDEPVKEPLEDEDLKDKDIEDLDEEKLEKPSLADSKELVDNFPEEEIDEDITSSETIIDDSIKSKDIDKDDVSKEIKGNPSEDIGLEDESETKELSDRDKISQEELDKTIEKEDIVDSKNLEDSDIDTDISEENIDKKKINDEKEK